MYGKGKCTNRCGKVYGSVRKGMQIGAERYAERSGKVCEIGAERYADRSGKLGGTERALLRPRGHKVNKESFG